MRTKVFSVLADPSFKLWLRMASSWNWTRTFAARPVPLYGAVAVLNLIVLAGALNFNHRLSATIAKAGETSGTWNQQLTQLENVRAAADELVDAGIGAVNAPDATLERTAYKEKARLLTKTLDAFRVSNHALSPGQINSQLGAMESALLTVTERTASLSDPNMVRETPATAAAIGGIKLAHIDFRKQSDALLNHLLQLRTAVEAVEVVQAKQLATHESVLIIVTLLMICCMAWFADQLGKLIRMQEAQVAAADSAAAKAETEMRQFAEQHEAVISDVSKLNVDLANNILKLKEAQDEILKKGKLAQLGQLTATVAHEIRNPLGAIRTATFLVERKIKDKGLGIEKQVERINNGVKRCDTIITELLDFARSRSLQLKTVTVDEWIRQKVQEEAGNLPSIVEFECDLGLANTEAAFDLDRMHRVFINLLTNASEAMVGKASEPVLNNERPSKIRVATALVAGNVEISVSDNGPGITEENMKRILEPLFTTKSFGVGLGLPAVEKILEQHGGGLRINSRAGEGATFTAFFPIQQRVANAA